METQKKYMAMAAKAVAERALKRDANQTSCCILYQPKAPAILKLYKKEKA